MFTAVLSSLTGGEGELYLYFLSNPRQCFLIFFLQRLLRGWKHFKDPCTMAEKSLTTGVSASPRPKEEKANGQRGGTKAG